MRRADAPADFYPEVNILGNEWNWEQNVRSSLTGMSSRYLSRRLLSLGLLVLSGIGLLRGEYVGGVLPQAPCQEPLEVSVFGDQ